MRFLFVDLRIDDDDKTVQMIGLKATILSTLAATVVISSSNWLPAKAQQESGEQQATHTDAPVNKSDTYATSNQPSKRSLEREQSGSSIKRSESQEQKTDAEDKPEAASLVDDMGEQASDKDNSQKQGKEKLDPVFEIPTAQPAKPCIQSAYSDSPVDLDPYPHLKLALKLTETKQYEKALSELKEALTRNPNLMEARYQAALVYQLMGKTEIASKLYSAYLKIKPDDAQAHINLGTLLKGTGHSKEAESELRKAIEISFYSFSAHYDLANLLFGKGLLQDALNEYKICLKLKPNSALVHNNLGVIYFRRNYPEEAQEEFQKASLLDPNNKVFQTNLTLVRQKLKQGAQS